MTDLSTVDGLPGSLVLREVMAHSGPFVRQDTMPADEMAALTGKVPDLLVDLWRIYGLGEIMGGRLRFVRPSRFRNVLAFLFDGDPDFGEGCHVIAHTAFGDFLVWSERHHHVFVSVNYLGVEAPYLFRPVPRAEADRILIDRVLTADPARLEVLQADGTPLFAAAKEAFGLPPYPAVYGFVPYPPMPPNLTLDHIRMVQPADYAGEIIAISKFGLHDFEGQNLNIRDIGPQP